MEEIVKALKQEQLSKNTHWTVIERQTVSLITEWLEMLAEEDEKREFIDKLPAKTFVESL